MDFDLGRSAHSSSRKHDGGGRERQSSPLKKKEMRHVSLFEKFISESCEKAHELAKEGAMLDEGEMAHVRATTIEQEVYAALQCAASFHC